MSVATTRAPPLARRTAARPSPLPISSTRSPGRAARCRQKNSEPAFGGWTPSATRNTAPRQAKRSSPASLPAKNLPEVEAEGFLELGARAGGGLRVLELLEVELEWHAFLPHPVALRSVGVSHREVRREVAQERRLGVERPLLVFPARDHLFLERRHRRPLLPRGR